MKKTVTAIAIAMSLSASAYAIPVRESSVQCDARALMAISSYEAKMRGDTLQQWESSVNALYANNHFSDPTQQQIIEDGTRIYEHPIKLSNDELYRDVYKVCMAFNGHLVRTK